MFVTGATGFIGRHLVARLVADGHTVHATYRGRSDTSFAPSVNWIPVADAASVADWTSALGDSEIVIHLAGLAHQSGAAGCGRTQEFMNVNCEMPRTIACSMAAKRKPMRMVFLSSVGAVASTSSTILTELVVPHPDTDYGLSKLAGERAIVGVLTNTAVDWCILRPPLVYGRGAPGNFGRLARLVRSGRPLPLGAVRSRRSVVYVGNLVDAILRCATSYAASRRTYFVADEEQPSLQDLLFAIGQALGRKPRILKVPLPVLRGGATVFELVSRLAGRSIGLDRYSLERLVGSLVVDASPISRELVWTAPYSLDAGLRATFCHGG